jgi:hypothetical protein
MNHITLGEATLCTTRPRAKTVTDAFVLPVVLNLV